VAAITNVNSCSEQRNHTRCNHGIATDNVRRDFEILQFRRRDLAINLSQRFETTHREHRMAEGNDDGNRRNLDPRQGTHFGEAG
jgi:hypothetical protein